jgi:hypothetical protein
MFLDLQNLAVQPLWGKKIAFQRELSIALELTDAHGKPVPHWKGGVPWIYDFGSIGFQISVPSESTLRIPMSGLTYNCIQSAGALILDQGLPESPPWHLAQVDREQYFLRATFKGLGERKELWRGTLVLPPVRMPTNPIPQVWPGTDQVVPSQGKP